MPQEKKEIPPLYGLVLAGGRSTRMGMDKASIKYHQINQVHYLAGLLSGFCVDVYISVRKDQEGSDIFSGLQLITDIVTNSGPIAGLYTALTFKPTSAWLTVPLDSPNLDSRQICRLVNSRKAEKMVTAAKSRNNVVPEPLFAIYEPSALSKIEQSMYTGNKSLRDIVDNFGKIIDLPYNILNINDKSDLYAYKEGLL